MEQQMIFSVSEANNFIKALLDRVPQLQEIFVRGEISNYKLYPSGHHYFSLKDAESAVSCVLFKGSARLLRFRPENGMKVIKNIKKESGLDLDVVKGPDEALLLVNNLVERTDSNEGNFAYVDVGGGSTEISLIHDGTLAESHSYNIGTLRLLSDRVTPETWKNMEADLQGYAKLYPDIHIIGSGGNINKLFKISKDSKDKKLSIAELQRLYAMLKPMSIEERMISFNLKDDRADVIVPAARIFLDVSKQLGCREIMVPNISLADSIVDGLYRNLKSQEKR